MIVGPKQARILVVSASPYTRYVISGELSADPDLFVVGTARTPDEVTYKRALLKPDLAVVDLESEQDLVDLKQTLIEVGLPVLALCSHTEEGAGLAFAALEAGAADVTVKPNGNVGEFNFSPSLLHKVRGLARVKPRPRAWLWPNSVSPTKTPSRSFLPGDRLVVVSAMMGGISPLVQLLAALPIDLNVALLILSSLPSCYVDSFLRRVSPLTAFNVQEVQEDSSLKKGRVYFVPQGYRVAVGKRGYLSLHSIYGNGKESPVDVTMSSLATQYGPAIIGVILSGVGLDGVQGARDVFAAGGAIIVQERASCLADETPAAVIDSGAVTEILPPEQIAGEVVRRVEFVS